MKKVFEIPDIELLRIRCEAITDGMIDGDMGTSDWPFDDEE